jgi:hypothetical protein
MFLGTVIDGTSPLVPEVGIRPKSDPELQRLRGTDVRLFYQS